MLGQYRSLFAMEMTKSQSLTFFSMSAALILLRKYQYPYSCVLKSALGPPSQSLFILTLNGQAYAQTITMAFGKLQNVLEIQVKLILVLPYPCLMSCSGFRVIPSA